MNEQIEKLKERANTLTHGFGIIATIVAAPFLLVQVFKTGSAEQQFAISVYAFSLLLMYVSSTLYHWVTQKNIKLWFRRLDHISIFFLIAGSYLPFMLIYFADSFGWTYTYALLGCAGIGTIYKLFFTGKLQWFSTLIYIAMGWAVIFVVKPMYNEIPTEVFTWIAIGGVLYSIGAVFYVVKKWMYHHAIWHVFVVLASAAHFYAVYKSVLVANA